MVRLVFFLENVSLAVTLRLPSTSSFFVATARFMPWVLRYTEVYLVPGARLNPATTCSASAICGTHFGLTNETTSISGKWHSDRRSIRRIFSAVDTGFFSICMPSRGPSSWITILLGKLIASSLLVQQSVDAVEGQQLFYAAGLRRRAHPAVAALLQPDAAPQVHQAFRHFQGDCQAVDDRHIVHARHSVGSQQQV